MTVQYKEAKILSKLELTGCKQDLTWNCDWVPISNIYFQIFWISEQQKLLNSNQSHPLHGSYSQFKVIFKLRPISRQYF